MEYDWILWWRIVTILLQNRIWNNNHNLTDILRGKILSPFSTNIYDKFIPNSWYGTIKKAISFSHTSFLIILDDAKWKSSKEQGKNKKIEVER
jgi:hypothetical protein